MMKFIETTEILCVNMTNLFSLLVSIYCQNVTGTAPPTSFDNKKVRKIYTGGQDWREHRFQTIYILISLH